MDRHRLLLAATALVASANLAGACSDARDGLDAAADAAPDPDGTPSAVSYERDVQPTWDRWCVRCHRPDQVPSPKLTQGLSRASLLEWKTICWKEGDVRPVVVAGDPGQSFLIYKLTGESSAPLLDTRNCRRSMPPDRSDDDVPLVELDPAAVETIRQWIDEGAGP